MADEFKAMSGLNGVEARGPLLAFSVAGVTQAEAARARLQELGWPPERLAKMPALQIVLADASVEIRRVADDAAKGHLLPLPEAGPILSDFSEQFQNWASQKSGATVGSVIGSLFFPAVRQASHAETRRVMTYNRLMTLEAIRMHVAEHDGELPDSLADLSPVPALPDPFSGEPFEYRVEDVDGRQRVTLRAAGPKSYRPMRELRFEFVKKH